MDSIVNMKEAVTLWEARDGAERGMPELALTVNLLLSQVKGFLYLNTTSLPQRSRQSFTTNKQHFRGRKKERKKEH